MTTFADQYKTDIAAIISKNMPGVFEIFYTPKNTAGSYIFALDGIGVISSIRDDDLGEVLRKSRDVSILTDPSAGIENPMNGDIVTIDDQDWKVVDVKDKDEAKATLSLVWERTETKCNNIHKKNIS